METVKIACRGATKLPLSKFKVLQGDLKELTEENYQKLRKEILNTGFAFAPHVWLDPNKRAWLVDGTQRITALRKMEEEGIKIPAIPVVPVQAKNLTEAKRRVLQGTSQYGHMTEKGLKEFLVDSKLEIEDVKVSFEFPEIDLPQFVDGHFRESPGEGEQEEHQKLADRFLVPPFSVLDAKQGYWQDRKRYWLSLGIKSELGRGGHNLECQPQRNAYQKASAFKSQNQLLRFQNGKSNSRR